MKARVRTILFVVLSLCLLGGSVFAGGGQESAATGPKKIVFQTFFGAGQEEVENGFVAQAVREAFPEWEFHVQWFTYSAYAEKLNLQIASGDLPDMTVVDTNIQLPRMVAEDQVIPLNDLLDEYGQNLLKFVPSWHWPAGTYDGKIMAIMNGWTTKKAGPYMRKDWLDNLGLDVPNTLEEFDAVLRAFTFDDPDGNGKDDTFGAGFREGVNWFDWVFHAVGVAPGHHHTGIWRKRGDRVEIDWVQPEMLDALKYIRGLYQDGVIIPESITFDGSQWGAAFTNGTMGTFYHFYGTLQAQQFSMLEKNPNVKLISVAPPLGPGGRGSSDEPMHWGFVISKKAQYPEEYVRLMDWFIGEGWDKLYGWFGGASPGRGFKELNAKGQAVAWSAEERSSKAVQDAMAEEAGERFYYITRPEDKWYATVSAEDRAFYLEQEKQTNIPEYYRARDNAQKYCFTSLKTKPVPSEMEYWGSLRTKYKEIMSTIVAAKDIDVDAVWKEWIDYWNVNGGETITQEVNDSL